MTNHRMPNKKKTQNKKKEEEVRCGGCDRYITPDGCDCNTGYCNVCGEADNLYNLYHPYQYDDELYTMTPYNERCQDYLCQNCR